MNEIEMLAFGYGLVEGPRVDTDDNLYFSDVHKGGVHRRRPDGTIETVVPKRGVNTLLPKLKAAGARDILEIPISKIVE